MKQEYNLFPDCKVVEGCTKGAIYDLRRGKVTLIPDTLCDILIRHEGFPYTLLKEKYINEHDTIEEYLNLLLSEEYIYKTESEITFESLSLDFETPHLIDNIIIDSDVLSKHNYEKVKQELSVLGCPNILLRFYFKINLDEIIQIVSYFYNSKVRDIVLMLPYQPFFTKELKKQIHEIRMVSEIILHSARYNKSHSYQNVLFTYTKRKIMDETHCGYANIHNFNVNLKMYLDSQNYNTCLHKKISIDRYGNIKNCPSSSDIFGNHDNDSLIDAISKKEFKSKWYIKKDDIECCKICVFRHMCIDCRIYLSDPKNIYSKPLKCKYDVHQENDENNLRI